MAEKVPIVVGTDGTYTRATSETFRKIAEGHVIEANAIVWVDEELGVRLLNGRQLLVTIFIEPHLITIHRPLR